MLRRTAMLACLGVLLAGVGCAVSTSSKSVPVLLYHRISADRTKADNEWVPLEAFEEQMRYLAEHGYSTLSVSDVVRFVRGAAAPRKAVCITFDDGWRSQLLAVPVLRRHGFKATFLLFPERGIDDPYGDYLRWADVQELARDERFEVGAHTMTHPWDRQSNLVTWANGSVPGRGMREVRHELEDSKRVLERALDRPVTVFAWPMGWYNDTLISLAREAGYQTTLTTDPGANRRGDDPFRIKRMFVDGSCTTAQFAELLQIQRYPACASGQTPSTRNTP